MSDTAQALFDELAAEHLGRPGVGIGRMFNSEGLSINGKLFAMVARGGLVVKISADQAVTLVAAGEAVPFESRPGRPLKEWISVALPDRDRWRELMADAHSHVAALASAG